MRRKAGYGKILIAVATGVTPLFVTTRRGPHCVWKDPRGRVSIRSADPDFLEVAPHTTDEYREWYISARYIHVSRVM